MTLTKVILMACGSFNPPTNMHLRMFEIARDHLNRLGNYEVIGGLISPVHDAYGKQDLASSTDRLAMIKLALLNCDWIKLSDWECRQEAHSRTIVCLRHHQNQINMALNNALNDNINEYDLGWFDILRNVSGSVKVKLLCGADLLESFGTPGLWADQDIDEIVGQHGLVVISRENSNPQKFIYMSDVLTKYMNNIIHVTEWINNDVSSTKVRRAIRRNESVRYLIPDLVIDYITKNDLYGIKKKSDENQMTVDTISKTNLLNAFKHPGQAVKIITDAMGDHKVYKKETQVENVKGNEAVLERPACLL